MRFVRRHMLKESAELNITAFLNLMVILVPFLLITAVFSRLTVLELNLPSLDAKSAENDKIELQLELLVKSSGIYVTDANLGLIKSIPILEGEPDWRTLIAALVEIKSRFPEEDSITLLLERGVEYKTLINIMDRVRSADIVQNATLETVELFPNISIGDAPVAASDGEVAPETNSAAAGGSSS